MTGRILVGDVRRRLAIVPDNSVHCVVTSPPYWGLRDYSTATWEGGEADCDHQPVGNWRDPKKNPAILSSNGHGPKSGKLGRDCVCGARRVDEQLGLEATPAEYIEHMVEVFREIRRVLRSDGSCWVNMGDAYNGQNERAPSILGNGHTSHRAGGANIAYPGLKAKDLCGMPWRLAFALQADGWWLRQDIIWAKPNPMPESVQDRCTKSHEYIFLFSKSEEYFFDAEAIKEKASTNSHTRGGGVNPKAKREGQHSRMRVDRDPRHIPHLPGNKTHKGTTAYEAGDERQRTKGGLVKYAEKMRAITGGDTGVGWGRLSKLRPDGHQKERGRIKQNESFSAAVTDLVTHRNKRSVWTMATAPFKEAHFATYPPALPRTCIKAGTSAKGCCSVCGRPFERIVERYDTGTRQKAGDGWDQDPGAHGTIHREGRSEGQRDVPVIAVRTLGWEEHCCDLFGGHAVPCTVLDPFAGAGTTGLVALELGRNFLGVELNAEYAMLAQRRLGETRLEVLA